MPNTGNAIPVCRNNERTPSDNPTKPRTAAKREEKELEFADELMGLYDQLFDATMEKSEEENKPDRLVHMDNLLLFESISYRNWSRHKRAVITGTVTATAIIVFKTS